MKSALFFFNLLISVLVLGPFFAVWCPFYFFFVLLAQQIPVYLLLSQNKVDPDSA